MSQDLSKEFEEFGRIVAEGAESVSAANQARLEKARASFISICLGLNTLADIYYAQFKKIATPKKN